MYKHNCLKRIQIGYIEYENHKIKITERQTYLITQTKSLQLSVCLALMNDRIEYLTNFINIMKHNNDNNNVHHSFLYIPI